MGCGASSSNQVNKNAVQAAPQNQNFPVNAQGFQASPNRNRYNHKENQPVGMTPFQKSPTKQNAKGSGQRGNMNNENVRLMQQRDSAETLPSHPNQNYRGLVEVSNFGDLLNEDEENQNVTFANGELSPIKAESANRLTRQQRSELINLRTFEQEIGKRYGDTSAMNKKVQVVRVRRQKTTLFNWPDSGQLEVQTISYRIVYSHAIKGFRTVKSKDQYITSLLSWFKDEDEDLYEFSLKDFLCTNLRSGNHLDLNTPEIYFQVDTDGKFVKFELLSFFSKLF